MKSKFIKFIKASVKNSFKNIVLVILLSLCSPEAYSQEDFKSYFTETSIRVDLILSGDYQTSTISIDGIWKQKYWGGSPHNLIDPFEYGEYKFHIVHESTAELIYSRGFGTLFEEWQTTEEAKTSEQAFDQVIVFPRPKNPFILEIFERDMNNNFQLKFQTRIDPNDSPVQEQIDPSYSYRRISEKGDPAEKLDIVFIAEGYTINDTLKFYGDVFRFASAILHTDPFKEYKESINFWAVASVSEDSGSDLPGESVWKNTIVNSNFYTFGSERYLMTEDIKAVREIAGIVPYDIICILVNTTKYGGGGIYNHYAIVSSDNLYAEMVLVHEIAHTLAGLGDEYYTASVAYEGFYNLDTEPWQPNLTTLVNFESKWKDLVHDSIPVPTPATENYWNVTGVFEGGGYVAKDIYRAEYDCRMKSNNTDKFCSACSRAIKEMIQYYSGK